MSIPTRIEASEPVAPDFAADLAMVQGLYYAGTGVWSLVDIDSFQKVTGPKVDTWLVKTVGTLVLVMGGTMGVAGWRRRIAPEIPLLAVGSALGLAAIDVFYVAKGRISKVYLLDAVAELGFAAAWTYALGRVARPKHPRPRRLASSPAPAGRWET